MSDDALTYELFVDHAMILSMLRRLRIQDGVHPDDIEYQLGDTAGESSHVRLLQRAARSLRIEHGGVFMLGADELRRIGGWLARKVDPDETRWEHYPIGWREDRARLAGGRWVPAKQREPGEDDE